MNKSEAFVYIWRDSNNSKFYLGYHKGRTDDNYAHSSTVMESFSMKSIPDGYTRRILAMGTNEEMIKLEKSLLENRKERGRWDKYYNVKITTYPYLWDDPEFCRMQSERAKAQWEDPEYRKMQSERMSVVLKGQWEDPEFRKMHSEMTTARIKKQWEDPEFRKMHSEKMKSQWNDLDFHKMQSEKMSVQIKKQWEDPEYRKKHSERMSVQWDDPEYRKKHSERLSVVAKKQWEDPEFRKKMRGTCSVCGHESTRSVIVRYHNDKCKHKA